MPVEAGELLDASVFDSVIDARSLCPTCTAFGSLFQPLNKAILAWPWG